MDGIEGMEGMEGNGKEWKGVENNVKQWKGVEENATSSFLYKLFAPVRLWSSAFLLKSSAFLL